MFCAASALSSSRAASACAASASPSAVPVCACAGLALGDETERRRGLGLNLDRRGLVVRIRLLGQQLLEMLDNTEEQAPQRFDAFERQSRRNASLAACRQCPRRIVQRLLGFSAQPFGKFVALFGSRLFAFGRRFGEHIQQHRLHPLQTPAVLVYRRSRQALNEVCLRFLGVRLEQRHRARLIREGDLDQFAQPGEAFDRPRKRGGRARAFPRGIGHRCAAERGEGRAHRVKGFLHMREGLADGLLRALGLRFARRFVGGRAFLASPRRLLPDGATFRRCAPPRPPAGL